MPSREPGKKPRLIMWQKPMKRMLYALAPIALASVYFFGWRIAALIAVTNAAGFLAEWLFVRQYREPVTSAVFVTGTLLALVLPPNTPFWMAAVGAAFAIVFAKMVFGGFGRNVFNPALVGRAFLYISFPRQMTLDWFDPVPGAAGGFAAWASDAVTGATPMAAIGAGEAVSNLDLFVGRIAGSSGETSAMLIILGGIYLLATRTANWRLVVSSLVGMLALQTVVWRWGPAGTLDPLQALLGGSFMFALFFFITEPVSAPRTDPARWVYGLMFGALGVIIRTYSVWPAGNMFAVILVNTAAPIMDYSVNAWKASRKAAVDAAASKAAAS